MTDPYDLVPVDHQPEFDHDLIPVDHDPFSAAQAPDANAMIQRARAQLAGPDLRDPAAFDPATYGPTIDTPANTFSPGTSWGNRAADIGSKLAYGAMTGVATLPQRAIDASAADVQHLGEPDYQMQSIGPAVEAAMLPMGTRALAGLPARAGEAFSGGRALESRSKMLYDPPVKPARPFEADYPGGGIADDRGRLRFDIDGRELSGAHISGRRVVRGGDEAILPQEFAAISEGSIGSPHTPHPAGELPKGSVGFYREVRGADGPERSIGYLNTLPPPTAEKVISHELGHAFDEMSGQIPTTGLNTVLRQLYNTLNTGQERTTNLTGPQHLGYGDKDVPRELMAEAIRAYLTNPNYIKTVAPKTAARIRQYVNANPRLSRTIQFNGVALPLATAAAYSLHPVDAGAAALPPAAYSLHPVDHDPFANDPFADTAMPQAGYARRLLASQNLRDPAAFDPATYAPTDPNALPSQQQIASRMPGVTRGLWDMIAGAATLPQHAIESAQTFSQTGEYDPGPILDAAMLPVGTGAIARMPVSASEALEATRALESHSKMLYDPPVKPARPFEADYPGGGIADDRGRLRFDIDGGELFGAHISGRRMVGGPDEAISPAQYDAISEGSIGSTPEGVAANSLPRNSVGLYREMPTSTGRDRSIEYLKTLSPPTADKVISHELGHAFDELSGQIPTAGLNTELRQIYNTLNTGRERTTNLTGPQHLGYGGEEVPREYMAEAIRAYLTNPNYIKTVAPKTAARIREYVNANPRLSRTIQFNGVALPLATGTAHLCPSIMIRSQNKKANG